MAKKVFSKSYLMDELELPYNKKYIIENNIYDKGRWTITYELIFSNPKDNKIYKTFYDIGATESQNEGPWEFENTIECYEVIPKMECIKTWVNKEELENSQKIGEPQEKFFLAQKIVYFYETEDWKIARYTELVNYYTKLNLLYKKYFNKNENAIMLKDGSWIKFLKVSENIRGQRYTKVIFENEPSPGLYNCVIKPSMCISDRLDYWRIK